MCSLRIPWPPLTSLGATTGTNHRGRSEHFHGLEILLIQGQTSKVLLGFSVPDQLTQYDYAS